MTNPIRASNRATIYPSRGVVFVIMIGTREVIYFMCAFMVATLASLWARELLGCWAVLIIFPAGCVVGFCLGLLLGMFGDYWSDWTDRIEKRAKWLAMVMIVVQFAVMLAALIVWLRVALGLLGMAPSG